MDLADFSPNWAPNGEFGCVQAEGGAVYPNTDVDNGYRWVNSTFSADQFAQTVVAAVSASGHIGPAVRMADGNAVTYYGYYCSSAGRFLVKALDGVITELGSYESGGVNATDVLRLEISQSKLTPYRNGMKDVLVGAHTDASITSGRAGLAALGIDPGMTLSSWEAGALGSPPEEYAQFIGGGQMAELSGQMEALTSVHQTISPDAIAASTNISGEVAAVQDDPDAPDGTWLTATSATAATDLRVTFPLPDGPLTPASTQTFRYLVRKTAGAPTPTLTAELREANALRKTFATNTPVTSTTGAVLQGDWTDADVVDTLGTDIELRLVSSPGLGASPLGHFAKLDGTTRTTTSTTGAELTNYTITWANLTAAGFVAGDNALIIIGVKQWGSSATGNYSFAVGFGTTFAGRSEDTTSVQRAEAPGTAAGDQYLWVKRRALVANQNIYFRGQATTGTASYDEFVCLILNYDDIGANDKLYAEATHSGNAPTSYDTSGAGAATPAAGDWWIVASSKWLVDGTAEDMFLAINDGTADIAEVSSESEDTADERVIGTMAYKAALGSGVTVRARYREAGATAPPDINATAIFGLRLDAFSDHWGQHTTNTITHSVIDTYQEFAGNGAYVLNNTGPFVIFGRPIHSTTEGTKRPYGRIQINNVDWLTATTNRSSVMDNGAAQRIAPLLFGYNATQAAATLDIDLDTAEDTDVSPTYTCVEQVAVAFSLFMPGAAVNTVEFGAIKWGATADVAVTEIALNADAVVAKSLSVSTGAAAVVQASVSLQTAAAGVVQKQIVATTSAAAAVLKAIEATTGLATVVQAQRQATTSADIGVSTTRTSATSADVSIVASTAIMTLAEVAVQASLAASASQDAAIQTARIGQATADSAVLASMLALSSADGAISVRLSEQTQADAGVAVTANLAWQCDTATLASLSASTSLDVVVFSAGILAELDIAVAVTRESQTDIDAAAATIMLATADVEAVVLRPGIARTASLDVAVFSVPPTVFVPDTEYRIIKSAENRTLSAAAQRRSIGSVAVSRTVTAPAIIPPEVA